MINLNQNARINAETEAGKGGDIQLQVRESLQLRNNSDISASTDDGQGGSITLNPETLPTDVVGLRGGSAIATVANGIGDAGRIQLNVGRLGVDDSAIAASTQTGEAGSVSIDAGGGVELTNEASVTVEATGKNGNSGDLAITTSALVADNSTILASTTSGAGGNITLQGMETLALNNSAISASTQNGEAGELNITASASIQLWDTSAISVAAEGGQAGGVTLNTSDLAIRDGSEISISNERFGNAGNLFISADDVLLNQNGRINAETRGGTGGNVRLLVNDTLRLQNDSEISATTRSGTGGDITVQEVDTISLSDSRISSSARTNESQGGTVRITASDRITLSGTPQNAEDTGFFAESRAGQGGDLFVRSNQLMAEGGAQISASTVTGSAGEITVRVEDSIQLSGNDTSISARGRGPGGTAGDIEIRTEHLTIEDGAGILASNRDARSGEGGNITLTDLEILEVNNGSITAETTNGIAGSLSIVASDAVRLMNGAVLSVETTAQEEASVDSSSRQKQFLRTVSPIPSNIAIPRAGDDEVARAGNLSIETNLVEVVDGSSIFVSSPTGQAGNVDIAASQLFLDNGQIRASTAVSPSSGQDSANIRIDSPNLLIMDNGSLISADAQNVANGGNISLNVKDGFIIASPNGNNDIIATAQGGDGGSIIIGALQLIGLWENSGEFEALRNNATNDISVTSTLGTDGVIVVNDLGLDPVQAAADLPVDTAAPPLTQGCQPGSGRGNFTNSARGGIPPRPGEAGSSDRAWEDILPHSPQPEVSPIVEARAWIINERGEIVLNSEPDAEIARLTCR